MLVDKADLGFGKRSWRYSMLVKDGVVQKMFVEPQKPGDPFEVSDADTMLAYVNPNAKKPDQVAIFTREGCQFCAKAKALLTELGYDYAEDPARAQRAQPGDRRRYRRADGAAGLRQRPVHRRSRGTRALGAEGGLTLGLQQPGHPWGDFHHRHAARATPPRGGPPPPGACRRHPSSGGPGYGWMSSGLCPPPLMRRVARRAGWCGFKRIRGQLQGHQRIMQTITTDIAILGAGTAGLAAYRAAVAAGRRALIIEAGAYGTTCARVGCMPSKLLIAAAEAAHAPARWTEFGLRLNGSVEVDGRAVMARLERERDRFVGFVLESVESIPAADRLRGYARFVDDHTLQVGDTHRVAFAQAVIATGSSPSIPPLLQAAGDRLVVNDDVFDWDASATCSGCLRPGRDRAGTGPGPAPARRRSPPVRKRWAGRTAHRSAGTRLCGPDLPRRVLP